MRNSLSDNGFLRVAVCSPNLKVGDPNSNAKIILSELNKLAGESVQLAVFPEMSLTGYTCGDLVKSQNILVNSLIGLNTLCQNSKSLDILFFVGAPIEFPSGTLNTAVAIHKGKILGIVPKTYLPNYNEFYEKRWFQTLKDNEHLTLSLLGENVPVATNLLFNIGRSIVVGVEICEDLWTPIPPSCHQALHGAHVLINLSASNELVGKSEYRRDLVNNQSARCISAYLYASSGPDESSTDTVFGGHCIISENGKTLSEKMPVGENIDNESSYIISDISIGRLMYERSKNTSFDDCRKRENTSQTYLTIQTKVRDIPKNTPIRRVIPQNPFVPNDPSKVVENCLKVFGIQSEGLARRLSSINCKDIYIGVSGGLDSTLALLVAVKAFQKLNYPLSGIHGITMPGYGTSSRTRDNAIQLMTAFNISQEEIDIRLLCFDMFRSIKHSPFGINISQMFHYDFNEALFYLTPEQRANGDLVFENVQARMRTNILFSKGFVLGTGDLSELALGWCTYNGDHMSNYNVNASVPKTLVKWLVKTVSTFTPSIFKDCDLDFEKIQHCLNAIADTTISPELLPVSSKGEILQSTENILGPYELHDFFLYHYLKGGCEILSLYDYAMLSGLVSKYGDKVVASTLKTFWKRFHTQQFKRNCVPDGPKVGSVSLSPRSDFKMPSDGSFIDSEIEALEEYLRKN